MALCDGASSLHTAITRAIDHARAQGLGERHQHRHAVQAVMGLEPELTPQAATRLVNAIMELRE